MPAANAVPSGRYFDLVEELNQSRPEGVVAVRVDPATGLLPGPAGADPLQAPVSSMEEYFLAGTEPREFAPVDAAVVAPVGARIQSQGFPPIWAT